MTSEIRTNSLKSRAGLSTVTMTDSGPMFSGITTFVDNSGFNLGTGSSIFTPASNTLTFGTNSNERFRITADGKIGIGIASPTFAAGGGVHLKGGNEFTSYRVSAHTHTGVDFSQDATGVGYVYNRDNADLILGTNNAQRVRINNSGAIGLGGANYGSSGQVLTSQGSGSAATWSTVSGTTINNNADNRLISGSNTANTLNGETNWYVSGSSLALGTTSPTANFHMRNSYVSMRIDSDGSNNDTKFYNVTGTGKNNYIYFGDAADDDVGQIAYDHNGDHMKFIVGASERMRLNSNGLQLGGSNGANHALDDYEEGTWTPTLVNAPGGASIGSATGYYTKVGNMCTLWLQSVTISGNNSSNNTIQVGGIPFSCASGFVATGIPRGYGVYRNSNHTWVTFLDSGNNIMWGQLDENVAWTQLKYSGLQNTSGHVVFQITLTYKTT